MSNDEGTKMGNNERIPGGMESIAGNSVLGVWTE